MGLGEFALIILPRSQLLEEKSESAADCLCICLKTRSLSKDGALPNVHPHKGNQPSDISRWLYPSCRPCTSKEPVSEASSLPLPSPLVGCTSSAFPAADLQSAPASDSALGHGNVVVTGEFCHWEVQLGLQPWLLRSIR